MKEQAYFLTMGHIDGREIARRITLVTPIEHFIATCGDYGWIVSMYTPVDPGGHSPVIKVETGME